MKQMCRQGQVGLLNILIGKLPVLRNGLMGMAIIAVITYHLSCWLNGVAILRMFKWGFIGVDVFMFASAFGLCFSYKKNSLSVFYCNRLKRIFPLLAFHSAIVAMIGYFYLGHSIGFASKSFIANITTLNYYVPCFSQFGSWFIPAIVLLYLIFPLLFKLMASCRILGGGGVIIVSIVCLFLSWKISPMIGWRYDCLMSRMPIFLLGILAFLALEGKAQIEPLDVLCWFAIWVLAVSFSNSRFFIAAMFCPIFLIFGGLLLSSPWCAAVFSWCGRHSLELFFGHALGARMLWAILDVDNRGGLCALAIMVVAMAVGCLIHLGASKILKKYLL